MPSLSIKDVPETLAEGLRQRAARNHRSLQGELMALVEAAVSGTEYAAMEPAAAVYAPIAPRDSASPSQPDAPTAAEEGAIPIPATRKERLRRLRELAAQAGPFSAADRLTRDEAHDRALLRKIGI